MVLLVMDREQMRSLRNGRGLSRKQLAGISGVSEKTLENAELGKTHARPSTWTLGAWPRKHLGRRV